MCSWESCDQILDSIESLTLASLAPGRESFLRTILTAATVDGEDGEDETDVARLTVENAP